MLDALVRYWWAVVLRGAAAVLFGLMAFIWPGVTITVLVLFFGAYALVDGVLALGSALFGGARDVGRRGWLAVEGAVGVGIGIATFVWPGITTLALLWVIAFWALVTGVLEIMAAIWLRRELRGEWLLALAGGLSVLFGIMLVVWPASGALALVTLIGAYAVVFGAAAIALGLRLRKLQQGGTVHAAPA